MDVGDLVPDFELPDQDGTLRRLSTLLAAGPVVLFFYPAAMTTGCTREACHFRDVAADYAAAGVQRVGISRDPVAKQKQFAEKEGLDYPLLSDTEGTVAAIFGVGRGGLLKKIGMPVKRTTFAIGQDGHLAAAIHSETNMQLHAERALATLKA
ncbi:MAG TPA: peroxiredoxin [Jatrophihabitans sp.]|jgi:peroxiredoxin Q/BCP